MKKIVQQKKFTSKWLDKSLVGEQRRREKERVELETLIQVNPKTGESTAELVLVTSPQQIPNVTIENPSKKVRRPIRERISKFIDNIYVDPYGKGFLFFILNLTLF